MNRELYVRSSFFNLLFNSILIPGQSIDMVTVSDGKANTNDKLYILIETQTASNASNFKTRKWDGSITLTICHKQEDSYTRDIVDAVCESIEDIIIPGDADNNVFGISNGWQILNVSLGDVSYADFQISQTETICIKYLTFNFLINKI